MLFISCIFVCGNHKVPGSIPGIVFVLYSEVTGLIPFSRTPRRFKATPETLFIYCIFVCIGLRSS